MAKEKDGDSRKLLDAIIALDLLRDQYALDYYERLSERYTLLMRRIERIVKPEYGQRITNSKRREILKEINRELEDFETELEEIVSAELKTASQEFYEQDSEVIKGVKPDAVIKEKDNLTRGMFKSLHPIHNGGIMSLDALYVTFMASLRVAIETIVNRLAAVQEESEVTSFYFKTMVEKERKGLNATSLTSIFLIASLTRQAFITTNKSLFSGYQWVSILDHRTSDYCQYRHARVWYFNDPERSTLPTEEYPPGHYRCRSSIAYILKGEDAPDQEEFATWFERQPDRLKREILGARRFELYQSGELDISDLHNVRGERRTLEELRQFI